MKNDRFRKRIAAVWIFGISLVLTAMTGCGKNKTDDTVYHTSEGETFWMGDQEKDETLPDETEQAEAVQTESESAGGSDAASAEETAEAESAEEMPKLFGQGDPEIDSESYCVIDDSGQVWVGKNELTAYAPASITKVLTALVVAERVDPADVVTVRESDLSGLAVMSSGISPSLRPGEEMTVQDLLYALLLPSTNAAGNVLASYVAGSVEAFADMMNAKVAELGLTHSHFMNPHGLDQDGHYTCAYDMCVIFRAAMADPVLAPILGAAQYVIPATAYCAERTVNMGHQMLSGQYNCTGVTGGKPGWTLNAQATLVTAFRRGEQNFYVCTMNSDEGDHYRDTDNLAAYVYGKAIGGTPVYHGMIHDITVIGDDEDGVTLAFRAVNGITSLRMVYWDNAVGTSGAVDQSLPSPSTEMRFRLPLPKYGSYTVQIFYSGPAGDDVVVFNVLHTGELLAEGIHTYNGSDYIIGRTGLLMTGAVEIESGSYYTNGSGALIKNDFGGGRFFLNEAGCAVTGWQTVGNETYYFQTDGRMATGRMMIEGEVYEFTDYGVLKQ